MNTIRSFDDTSSLSRRGNLACRPRTTIDEKEARASLVGLRQVSNVEPNRFSAVTDPHVDCPLSARLGFGRTSRLGQARLLHSLYAFAIEDWTSSFTPSMDPMRSDSSIPVGRSDSSNLTYLDYLVPSCGDDDWVGWVWGKSDARHPLGVSLLLDGELAVSEGVP